MRQVCLTISMHESGSSMSMSFPTAFLWMSLRQSEALGAQDPAIGAGKRRACFCRGCICAGLGARVPAFFGSALACVDGDQQILVANQRQEIGGAAKKNRTSGRVGRK